MALRVGAPKDGLRPDKEDKTMSGTVREQVDRNYEAFVAKLSSLLETYREKYALMHDGEVVVFFDTAMDAHTAGREIFKDDAFSIQQVTDAPIDLGVFSHAVSLRAI